MSPLFRIERQCWAFRSILQKTNRMCASCYKRLAATRLLSNRLWRFMTASETQSQLISNAIRGLLEDGLTGALATLMDSPQAESNDGRVGATLLINETGDNVGSLGHDELDKVDTQHL